MWAEHPDALRIDQSPANTVMDETADFRTSRPARRRWPNRPVGAGCAVSVGEGGEAGTAASCRVRQQDNLTAVCNALAAARVTGVGLVVGGLERHHEGRRGGRSAGELGTLSRRGSPVPRTPGRDDLDVFLASWVNTQVSAAETRARSCGEGCRAAWSVE